MKNLSLEKIWERYPNKYLAMNVAALEARRFIEAQQKGEYHSEQDVHDAALGRLVAGELKHERLTEAEMEAINREGYGEPSFGRMP